MHTQNFFKAALVLLGLCLALGLWQIPVLVSALWLLYYGIFFYPKLSELRQGGASVIRLPNQKYAVPIHVIEKPEPNWIDRVIHPMRRWTVDSISPELEGESLVLDRVSAPISKVQRIGDREKSEPASELAKQMSVAIKAIYHEIQPEILALTGKLEVSQRMESLGRSSALYAQRAEIFSHEICQLEQRLNALKALHEECLEFVRNVLIGAVLSKHEAATQLPDSASWELTFQTKYSAIQEQGQLMADEESALADLRKEIAAELD